MSYTPVNLLNQYTPPALASVAIPQTVYDYDTDRNLKKVTRPDGKVLNYAFDTADRLATITTPAGTITNTYSTGTGHLTGIAASADGVSLDLRYDGPLRTRLEWSGAVAGVVAWTYNNDFRPTAEDVGTAPPAHAYFGYDNDGLMTCASPTSCSPPAADALTLTYSPSNGLLTTTTLGTITDTLTYNEFGELASETAQSGTTELYKVYYHLVSPTVTTINYPRDALGRVLRSTQILQGSAKIRTYAFDSRGQLVKCFGGISYAYDPNGNRRSVTTPTGTTSATYDAQDRLLTYGTFSYTYTANGELQTKTNSATGDVTTYQYDVLGNLKRVDLPQGNFVEYLVDGQNRRVAKKKNGAFVEKWLYRDQLHPVAELDGAGNFSSRFIYATGRNSPDVMIQAGVQYRILTDQLGSPRVIANAATGAVVQRMRHDEFGIVL